jgi:AcrR family transcriptional regulator
MKSLHIGRSQPRPTRPDLLRGSDPLTCSVAGVSTKPLSGRRAEASRNDARVLDAARAVLTADPEASMADIARRAGVGIGTLYRRYPSKEALVLHLCQDGMERLEAVAQNALARPRDDPWVVFSEFMEEGLEAGAGALGAVLAGTFTPSRELLATARRLHAAVAEVISRAHAAGVLREDVTQEDINLLFEQLRSVKLGDEKRTAALQRRYLALTLQALRAPAAAALPGPAPSWKEIQRRWR